MYVPKGLMGLAMIFLSGLNGLAEDDTEPLKQAEQAMTKKVRSLLGSDQPHLRAWGAYYAGKHKLADFGSLLFSQLKRRVKRTDREARAAQISAASALIEIGTELTDDELNLLFSQNRNTLALASIARHPQNKQKHLFRLIEPGAVRKCPNSVWVACCNLLTKSREKGIAAHLIRNTRVQVTVLVRDPLTGFGGGRRGSARCSDGSLTVGARFPPIVHYGLSLRARTGDLVLAPGPSTVYLRRFESHRKGVLGFGSVESEINRGKYRLQCLASLVYSTPKDSGIRVDPNIKITWRNNPDEMRKTATTEFEAIIKKWQTLADKLLKKRLLDPGELPQALPEFDLVVEDRRKDKTKKLPALGDLTKGVPSPKREDPRSEKF